MVRGIVDNRRFVHLEAMMAITSRLKLLLFLALMPDEAFSYLVLAIAPDPWRPNVWPDELGEFQAASRTAITEARAAADNLMRAHGEDV